MSHCPQCGRKISFEGAAACAFCGTSLRPALPVEKAASQTMVGVSVKDLPLSPAPAAGAPSKVHQTIVGMPKVALPDGEDRAAPPDLLSQPLDDKRTLALYGRSLAGDGSAKRPSSPDASLPGSATIVGMNTTLPLGSNPLSLDEGALPPEPPAPAGGTLLGVAHPGIAPLALGALRDMEGNELSDPGGKPPGYPALSELGATIGPGGAAGWPKLPAPPRGDKSPREDLRRRRMHPVLKDGAPPKKALDGASKRALLVVFAAGALALAAVFVALFWPSAPPLTAQARADAEGREGVELRCATCPDGTKVRIGDASATIAGGTALVPLPSALALGENRLKVVIDRPGSGRDETVGVTLNVAYRIRPELTTLQAERPMISLIIEAASGTRVTIDNKPIQLSSGRAVENVDVSDSVTGLSAEPKALTRQIPYSVTPESGPPERGIVNVSVGIVPLTLEAPGPHVIIDGTSFILAGRTMKGAEVLAAGRPIAVRPDGTFAQVMNVSSIGATQVEVRAKLVGLAPRLSLLKVRRVDNLETAAREFLAEQPISYAPLAQNLSGQIGRPIALTGDVIETRKQGYATVMLLDVARSSGCPSPGACAVRLVQGADNPAKKGDTLRVFGHVASAFSSPGRADIPEIEVDFTLKSAK